METTTLPATESTEEQDFAQEMHDEALDKKLNIAEVLRQFKQLAIKHAKDTGDARIKDAKAAFDLKQQLEQV